VIKENKKSNGSKSFRAKVYVNGKQITKTFRRKTDAELWKKKMVVDRERGELGLELSQTKQTIKEFSEEWIKKNH
jgi:hypothetical protein